MDFWIIGKTVQKFCDDIEFRKVNKNWKNSWWNNRKKYGLKSNLYKIKDKEILIRNVNYMKNKNKLTINYYWDLNILIDWKKISCSFVIDIISHKADNLKLLKQIVKFINININFKYSLNLKTIKYLYYFLNNNLCETCNFIFNDSCEYNYFKNVKYLIEDIGMSKIVDGPEIELPNFLDNISNMCINDNIKIMKYFVLNCIFKNVDWELVFMFIGSKECIRFFDFLFSINMIDKNDLMIIFYGSCHCKCFHVVKYLFEMFELDYTFFNNMQIAPYNIWCANDIFTVWIKKYCNNGVMVCDKKDLDEYGDVFLYLKMFVDQWKK